MWMEAIRVWTAATLAWLVVPGWTAGAAAGGLWVLREGLWFNLERVMLACVFAALMRSTCGGWAGAWLLRRGLVLPRVVAGR